MTFTLKKYFRSWRWRKTGLRVAWRGLKILVLGNEHRGNLPMPKFMKTWSNEEVWKSYAYFIENGYSSFIKQHIRDKTGVHRGGYPHTIETQAAKIKGLRTQLSQQMRGCNKRIAKQRREIMELKAQIARMKESDLIGELIENG